MSPLVEDGPTQLLSHIRCGAQRWYDEHNGRTVRRTSGDAGQQEMARVGIIADAVGRPGAAIGCAHGACGLLGVMGGRIAHDSRATSRSGRPRRGPVGRRAKGSVGELKECTRILDQGVRGETQLGRIERREAPSCDNEPGEWYHGWQYHSSSASEHHFRESMVLRQSCAADQAHLRSHAGPSSSDVLSGAPTGPEFRVCPELFRTLVLERLRLPLEVVESQCECGTVLDTLGRHRAACPRSGRLRTWAGPPERTMARMRLREMNVAVSANDERSIEVLASGLPLQHGAQLAVDVTLSDVTSRAEGTRTPKRLPRTGRS